MAEYTQLGLGDLCQADEPEDTRPQCPRCNERHDDGATHCSLRCWHLDNISEVKDQILCWLKAGIDDKRIIRMLSIGDDDSWFCGMTDSTVRRWEVAIAARYEQDPKAQYLENCNDI